MPLTIGARRARNARLPTISTNATVTSASATISDHGMAKPGTSASISITAPTTNATMPPTPSDP